jgi:hypothetical protein
MTLSRVRQCDQLAQSRWLIALYVFLSLLVSTARAEGEGHGGFFSDEVCFEDKGADPDRIDSLKDLTRASTIGWIISGAAAAVATTISMVLIIKHAQYYHKVSIIVNVVSGRNGQCAHTN